MSVRQGWMVASTVYEYDDNYMNATDGAFYEKHVYRDKADAEARCNAVNLAHAFDVVQDPPTWIHDCSLGEFVLSDLTHSVVSEAQVRRLHAILCPNVDDRATVAEMADDLDKLGEKKRVISPEDLQWLVGNFAQFRNSYVEEVLVEDFPHPYATP